MRHIKPVRIFAIIAALIVTTFSHCGKFAQSRTYQAQKAATISSTAVFSPGDVVGRDEPRVPEPGEPGNPTPPPPPPPPPVPPTKMPIELYCSAEGASIIGSTLQQSPNTLIYGFKDSNGAEVCSFSEEGARDDLINTSRVNIKDLGKKCPALREGNYVMTIKSPNGGGSMLMTLMNMGDYLRATTWQQVAYYNQNWIGHPLHVDVKIGADKGVTLKVTDRRPCDDIPAGGFLEYGGCENLYGDLAAKVLSAHLDNGLTTPVGARCDHGVSPLIIRLAEHNQGIQLSPPLSGIDFDIMGINSTPPYKPKRISWFSTETAKDDYFLVLPNARGEVLGIDQMFGDNTLTPDGHVPPKEWNGYAALGLHDGRRADGSVDASKRDGFITEQDEVFPRLRLWHDTNRDGVAQPEEMSSLEQHGIVRIDLTFDPDHVETDDFGNATKMKSTVQTRDGRTHLIYDLWFRAL